MREIKFRAWDEEEEKMINPNSVFIHNGKMIAFRVDNSRKIEVKKFDDETVIRVGDIIKNIELRHENLTYLEGIKLMQFTGRKDKNGKEIYEGDIVRIQHPLDKCGDFADTLGRVFWSDDEGAFYHGHCTVKDGNTRPPKRMWEYCEVVGNEFENPELLKQSEGGKK